MEQHTWGSTHGGERREEHTWGARMWGSTHGGARREEYTWERTGEHMFEHTGESTHVGGAHIEEHSGSTQREHKWVHTTLYGQLNMDVFRFQFIDANAYSSVIL